jgi:nucleotide-binding universal stress UspA family protein
VWAYPPKKILAAVDFGDASNAALRLAGELARRFEAALTALHAEVFEAPPYFTADQVKAIEQQRRSARRAAGDYLEKHASKLAGVEVEAVITEGPPAAGILTVARTHDLIVMGTHGRRGPARWWAGSVAERVVREGRSPVLVVRTAGAGIFKRIAIAGPANGSPMRYARGLAEVFGGEADADLAPEDATLVVLAQPSRIGPVRQSVETDRLLRTCRRPLLFVPAV